MILAMLALIDAALVASLIVMVMISGYENFVSRFDEAGDEVSFLGKLDAAASRSRLPRRSSPSRRSTAAGLLELQPVFAINLVVLTGIISPSSSRR